MNETEKKFKSELDDLFKKYKVELSFESELHGYAESHRLNAYAYSRYDINGDQLSETINLDLGNYYTGE